MSRSDRHDAADRNASDDAGHVRYAAGLPFTERRKLTSAEHAWLKRRIRTARRNGIATIAALAGSVLAAVVLAQLLPGPTSQIGGAFGVWLAAAGAVGSIAALRRKSWLRIVSGLGLLYLAGLAAIGALIPELTDRPHLFTKLVVVGLVAVGSGVVMVSATRRALVLGLLRRVRDDARGGFVDRFVGTSSSGSTTQRRLATTGYLPRDGSPLQLDVLPASGLLIRVGSRTCRPWVRAHLARIAAGQPHALRVGLPEGVAPSSSATHLHLQRRSLSPQERAELDQHIQRLRRRPWSAIAATAGLLVAMVRHLSEGSGSGWMLVARLVDPMLVGWYALTALTVVAYVRRTIAARKLDDDRRLRWVVTVDDAVQPGAVAPPRLEVLPVSQLAWTENATPAGWRTSKL